MAATDAPPMLPEATGAPELPPSQGDTLKLRIFDFWKQRLAQSESDETPPEDSEKAALVWALGRLPVSLFPKVPKVVEVSSSALLAEAISVLEHHNFRCLPVRSAEHPASHDWAERYLGVVDHPGIVLWVFASLGGGPEEVAAETEFPSRALLGLAASTAEALYGEFKEGVELLKPAPATTPAKTEGAEGAAGVPGKGQVAEGAWYATGGLETFRARFRDEITRNAIFHDNKVGDVIGSFRFTPFIPVSPDESVLSVLLLMAQRVRLVPIIQPQGPEIENVVTPMGVLDFLCGCVGLPWFDCIARQPISALGLPLGRPDDVIKVEEGDRVMEAFRLMLEHDVSGVPVVGPMPGGGGRVKVVANVSASDILRLLHCPRLFEGGKDPREITISDFIGAVEADASLGGRRDRVGPTMRPPICCGGEERLADVMATMKRARIRRVYVSHKDGSILGIVTLRDIIAVFTSSHMGRPERTELYGA